MLLALFAAAAPLVRARTAVPAQATAHTPEPTLPRLSRRADALLEQRGLGNAGALLDALLHGAGVGFLGLALLLLGPWPGGRALPLAGLLAVAVHPACAAAAGQPDARAPLLAAALGWAAAAALLWLTVPWRPSTPRSRRRAAAVAGAGSAAALLCGLPGLVFAPLYALLGLRHSRSLGSAALAGCALGAGVGAWIGVLAPDGHPLRLPAGARLLEALRVLVLPLEGGGGAGAPEAALAALGWLVVVAALAAGIAAAARWPRSPRAWSAVLAPCALLLALPALGPGRPSAWLQLPLALAVPLVDAAFRSALPARGLRRGAGAALVAIALLLCWRWAAAAS